MDVLADLSLADSSDPANPACTSPSFVGGDDNGDALLDRDETWTYTCPGVVDQPTTNVAAVHGTDIAGGLVLASDAAFVQPFEPGIGITKTATPTRLVGSGEVTYTYEVVNTGDVPLAGVSESIADDTCSPVQFVGGDNDGDGLLDTAGDLFESGSAETWEFTCAVEITEDTVNTVVVDGSAVHPDGSSLCEPPDGVVTILQTACDVSASADAVVEVSAEADPKPPPDPDAPLPDTGTHLEPLVLLAGLAMLVGALAMAHVRSRSSRTT